MIINSAGEGCFNRPDITVIRPDGCLSRYTIVTSEHPKFTVIHGRCKITSRCWHPLFWNPGRSIKGPNPITISSTIISPQYIQFSVVGYCGHAAPSRPNCVSGRRPSGPIERPYIVFSCSVPTTHYPNFIIENLGCKIFSCCPWSISGCCPVGAIRGRPDIVCIHYIAGFTAQ